MSEEPIDVAPGREPDQTLPGPAASGARILSLDFVRGLAVMGILLANIVGFGQPFSAYVWPDGFLVPAGDPGGWMWIAQFVLIDGKMRGLFTLLFGAGMVLFLDRARERGAGRSLQVRRLAWLFVFGLAHFFLLWRGDILMLYAVCGLLALVAVRWRETTQLGAGLVGYVLGALLWTASFYFMYLMAETPFGRTPQMTEALPGILDVKNAQLADDAIETALMREGTWFDIVAHRLVEHPYDWVSMIYQVGWETIPLMLIGMALYRAGLFDGRMDPRKQRLWGWIGLLGGAAATLPLALWAQAREFSYFSTMFVFIGPSMLTRLPMILGLAALLALWAPHARGWLGQRVVAAGRMAFSNYLGTSFVMLFLFSPWSLDLFGKLDRPQLYLVVVLTWVLILGWSKPWLARFRYGPLEWLWRCLTYWRPFPLKR